MATQEDARQRLIERLGDPTISKDEFDELNRRIRLLEDEK